METKYIGSKYQMEPTEKVKTNEDRFVEVGKFDMYKVAIITMLAYIIAKLNKLL